MANGEKTLRVGFNEQSLDALSELWGKVSDAEIRRQCLEIASTMQLSQRFHTPESFLALVGQLESYVRYGRQKEGFTSLAPECFISEDENVIAFRGENFYRACDFWVRNLEGGGTSHCVKRAGHPGTKCEDYDGHVRDREEEN